MNRLENLTREKLLDLYHQKKKSLEDIAILYGVSRTAIYKKLKGYSIPQRSKSEARLEAQKQGKLPQKFFDINETFFSQWSTEMAYVLGLIITDGCIAKTGHVALSLNDRELLEKVRAVMESSHKIVQSKHQKGLYYYHFGREKMIQDLDKLGVGPRKSLNVRFPKIPDDYIRDFIRGVFDGDGSVFFDKRKKACLLKTKFVSSSPEFINTLQESLESLGLPKRTVYKQKTINAWSYEIVYAHKDSIQLFDILYKNVKNNLYLERKHNKFLEGMKPSKTEG